MIGILLQMDQATEVMRHAVTESGWMAGLLVLIVLAALALFGVMIRGDRSELRAINKFLRSEMLDAIDGNTIAFSRFASVLHGVPCLHKSDLDKIEDTDPRKMSDAEITELDVVSRKAVERIKRRADRRARAQEDSDP
jgi:hypothetical protein